MVVKLQGNRSDFAKKGTLDFFFFCLLVCQEVWPYKKVILCKYFLGFHGYGYFQAAAAAAQTSPNAQANGILPPNNEQRQNGSSYYTAEYASNNRNDSRADYGRNGEMVQISNQLTTGTSTPALVAQALSGTKLVLLYTL